MSVSLGSLFTAGTSGKYLLLFSAPVKKEWCPAGQRVFCGGLQIKKIFLKWHI